MGAREDNAPEYICKPEGTSLKDPPPGYLSAEAEDGCKDNRGSGPVRESSAKSVPPLQPRASSGLRTDIRVFIGYQIMSMHSLQNPIIMTERAVDKVEPFYEYIVYYC